MFSRLPYNALFGIPSVCARAKKLLCGGDNSCISQLIAIYLPQANCKLPTLCFVFLAGLMLLSQIDLCFEMTHSKIKLRHVCLHLGYDAIINLNRETPQMDAANCIVV